MGFSYHWLKIIQYAKAALACHAPSSAGLRAIVGLGWQLSPRPAWATIPCYIPQDHKAPAVDRIKRGPE